MIERVTLNGIKRRGLVNWKGRERWCWRKHNVNNGDNGMSAIDPDNLIQFRNRLNIAGEFLCGLTDNPEARKAYVAVLYVQSSLKLDAEEMRLANKENPWAHIPKQYAGRWGYDYDEKNGVFFVHCGGHRILDAEDSEVCDAVCRAHNMTELVIQDMPQAGKGK